MERTFIDLGLPSGRLWATDNEPGHYQFNKAVKTFGEMLPTIEAWKELFNHCSHKWYDDRKGVVLTGPNGNSIFLPANGYQTWDIINKRLNNVDVAGEGYYWSSTPYSVHHARGVYIDDVSVNPWYLYNPRNAHSVRLCKSK